MNMQQMIAQAQKMQRELKKAKDALHAKEFTLAKGGLVTIVMYGNKQIKSITLDKDAVEPDNKEMIEDMVASCVNELITKISEEEEKIEESITGQRGMGF